MVESVDILGEKLLVPKLNINDLTQAIKDNNVDLVKHLLDLNIIDINKCDSHFFTPLQVDAKHGHSDIAKLLLERGADSDLVKDVSHSASCAVPLAIRETFNCKKFSALQLAIKHNNTRVSSSTFRSWS